jgi:hypothetical protein
VTAVVTSTRNECSIDPFLAPAGPVTFTVTAAGRVPISVSIFAPENGAFTDRLARVRLLRSGESKAINLTMTQGAYEVSCESSGRTNKSRLTVT